MVIIVALYRDAGDDELSAPLLTRVDDHQMTRSPSGCTPAEQGPCVGTVPSLDGVMVARHVWSREPTVPVVLMSGVPSTEAPAEVPVLREPFTVGHLIQVITTA
jgi:hypothetical protein